MDWIKARTNLHRDPRVSQIATACKIDVFSAMGRLLVVWGWAGEFTETGIIIATDDDVDRIAEHKHFAAAMRLVGWLSGDAGSLQLPNWQKHNASCARARALAAARQMSRRCHADVTKMSRSERDTSVTREDKRREDKKVTPPPSPSYTGSEGQRADTAKAGDDDGGVSGEARTGGKGNGQGNGQGEGKGANGNGKVANPETVRLLTELDITPRRLAALSHADPAMVQTATREAKRKAAAAGCIHGSSAASGFDVGGYVVRYLEARL